MRLLFVHQNFPGQYRHLAARYAAQRGNQVVAIGEKANLSRQPAIPGVTRLGYDLPAKQPLQRAKAVAAVAAALRRSGFRPDVVFAHIGWGEAVFLKDVFPEAKLLLYGEFFYRASGSDVGFDPEFAPRPDTPLRLRLRNAPLLMALDAADWVMAPTQWQRRQLPAAYQASTSVIHDGIDTDSVFPIQDSFQEEIVTYVARNLEPYRGFHVFMRAIPEIQKHRPRARIVIVGGDEVSYSPRLPPGQSYRARLTQELGDRVDWSRVEFRGKIPYRDYLALLRRSSAHVYLTYPFVLSWSLLEAMSAGCLVVASRTPPVEEVIRDGENGLLVDFFSTEQIAERIHLALTNKHSHLRRAARQAVVNGYDLKSKCLPAQLRLVETLQRERSDARPAADVEHLAGDEARVPVGEEQHRTRDVVGLA